MGGGQRGFHSARDAVPENGIRCTTSCTHPKMDPFHHDLRWVTARGPQATRSRGRPETPSHVQGKPQPRARTPNYSEPRHRLPAPAAWARTSGTIGPVVDRIERHLAALLHDRRPVHCVLFQESLRLAAPDGSERVGRLLRQRGSETPTRAGFRITGGATAMGGPWRAQPTVPPRARAREGRPPARRDAMGNAPSDPLPRVPPARACVARDCRYRSRWGGERGLGSDIRSPSSPRAAPSRAPSGPPRPPPARGRWPGPASARGRTPPAENQPQGRGGDRAAARAASDWAAK